MPKYKAIREVELFDLTTDYDGDGNRKALKLQPGEYVPVDDLDMLEFKKSLAFGHLRHAIKAGWIIEEPEPAITAEEIKADIVKIVQDLVNQVIMNDVAIRFQKVGPNWDKENNRFDTNQNSIQIKLKVCDGDGTIDLFQNTATVVVSATGSATIVETMPITFTRGEATITVNDNIDEIVTLSLSGGNTDLDKSDTVNINFHS
jgi:hypothetical protein